MKLTPEEWFYLIEGFCGAEIVVVVSFFGAAYLIMKFLERIGFFGKKKE